MERMIYNHHNQFQLDLKAFVRMAARAGVDREAIQSAVSRFDSHPNQFIKEALCQPHN